MRGFKGFVVVLVGFLWTFSLTRAQEPASVPTQTIQARPPGSGRTDGRQVRLDVVVTDKSGRAVGGLREQDFSVLDDKQPAKILAFRAHSKADLPAGQVDASTEVIIVLDEVNAPYSKVAYAREGVEAYLRQDGGNLIHPVALAFFTDGGLQVQTKPAVDGDAIADALHKRGQSFRAMERGTGFYGDEQKLKESMDALDSLIAQERGKPGRKMVIWVSPGWPLLSGPRDDISEQQRRRVFGSVVGLTTALEQARMTLYSVDSLGAEGVGTTHTSFYQNFTKELTKPADAEMGDLGLQVLVTQTGGQAIFGNDAIATSINRCVGDLDAFYTLVIEAAPAEKADQFHAVEVKVGMAGIKVRTRDGYYAQP